MPMAADATTADSARFPRRLHFQPKRRSELLAKRSARLAFRSCDEYGRHTLVADQREANA